MKRLTQRADFVAAASGIKAHAEGFVVQRRDRGDTAPPRVGFTVSRQVGNAVERNRVRRRLREAVRTSAAPLMQAGSDYVIVGRRASLVLPFARLVDDLSGAIRRTKDGARAPRHRKAP
jgi:ribonuclease P protein component